MDREVESLFSIESEASGIFTPSEDSRGSRQEKSSLRMQDQTENAWRRRRNLDQTVSTQYQKTKLALIVMLLIFILAWLGKQPANTPQMESKRVVVPQVLTVHLIPHSHDDVGWIKTVDEYFYGANLSLRSGGVQYTIDTVVSELTEHPQYRFVIVEMAFLYRWWHQASEKDKNRMKALVANGQLQFINGGWCASEQATIYYEDFIDQMTLGLRWMKETFDYVPDVAWHIDPFGHHSSTASLFRQMGFNSLFFARIDYLDKEQRKKEKALQMVWEPPQLTGFPLSIFTHIQYSHYSPPKGFFFDSLSSVDVIKDDPTLQGYNLDVKSIQLVNWFKQQSTFYRTKNIMHTIGQDFTYMNARMQFKNFQKLIKYINIHPQFEINIRFSTPNDYIHSIRKEKHQYPVKTDDFFPYSDGPHSFWTGFFTSRVALKGFVKDFSRYFQAAKRHISELKIANISDTVRSSPKQIEKAIFQMDMAHGILQHHDGVSGTATQRVSDDYVATGLRAISAFNKLYSDIKKEEIQKETAENVSDLHINLFWNETGTATGLSQSLNAGKTVLVSFYNPGSKGTYPVRLRVSPKDLNVLGQDNLPIPGDVVCANLRDTSDCELLFNLAIGESSNAYVKLSASKYGNAKIVPLRELTQGLVNKDFILGNDRLRLMPSSQFFDLTLDGDTRSFKIFYNNYVGWSQNSQPSGAYIFRPTSHISKLYSQIHKIYVVEGITTVMIVLEGDKTLTRVYFSTTHDYVQNYGFMIETQVDSISIDDGSGKEVTLNLKTDFHNNFTFFTDSMGLEEQQRIINFRPAWNLTVYEPAAGNYYPINSFIRMRDAKTQSSITVLTDRSQGGSVLREGEIEIMIHRRLLVDDWRGVEEPLNQTDADGKGLRQTVRHYVVFGEKYRQVQKWIDQRILPTFGISQSDTFKNLEIRLPPIKVPQAVKLYLRPYEDGSYLMRFHSMNVQSVSQIDLEGWVLQELTLGANQRQSQWRRTQLKWRSYNFPKNISISEMTNSSGVLSQFFSNAQTNLNHFSDVLSGMLSHSSVINLKPFEMRTFKASLK